MNYISTIYSSSFTINSLFISFPITVTLSMNNLFTSCNTTVTFMSSQLTTELKHQIKQLICATIFNNINRSNITSYPLIIQILELNVDFINYDPSNPISSFLFVNHKIYLNATQLLPSHRSHHIIQIFLTQFVSAHFDSLSSLIRLINIIYSLLILIQFYSLFANKRQFYLYESTFVRGNNKSVISRHLLSFMLIVIGRIHINRRNH